jgi:hypothetical protein
MGYRGEDVSRTPANWAHQAPGQSSPGVGQGGTGSWVDGSQGYGNDGYDDYASDGAGYGYQGGDGYGGYPQPEQGQYGQRDAYSPQAPYAGPGGYDQPADYGYQGPEDPYGQQGQFGQPEPGYGGPGGGGAGYQAPSDGYPARHASGAYPALPDGSDGYQGRDAGNDWYGGQPAAASGASFADTGTYALNGRIIEEYGTGPNETMNNPARGYPPTPGQPQGPGQLPGRAQLPAPARPVISGPQAVPRTGAQERYDDHDSYPGYGGEQYQDQGGRQTGEYPAARNPTGGYPATVRNPTGEYPTALGAPTGEYPTGVRNPSGAYPAAGRNPTGEYPTTVRNPSGGYPTAVGDGYDAYGSDAYGQDLDYDDHGNPAAGYDDYATDDPYQEQYGDGAGRNAGAGGRAKPKKGGPRKGGGRPAGRASAGGRRSRLLPLVLGTVFVVLVACAAAYFLVLKPHSSTPNPDAGGRLPTAGASPSDQACVQQYGPYCHIELRTLDPAPLTLAELFPPVVNNEASGGHITSSFTLETTKLDSTCSSAVIGQTLITTLKAGACTQVLRASYLSGDGKIMGTIGVINLATTSEAHHAGKVVGQNDFIAPLATSKGIASKLGQGTGVVEAQYKGHYLILTWSEFVNGSTPSTTAQDDQLEAFNSDLVAGTANINLSERMVQGDKPAAGASAS